MPVSLFDFRTLTETVNRIIPTKTVISDNVFANKKQVYANHIEVDIVEGRRKIAPITNPNREAPLVSNLTRKKEIYSFPNVKQKKILDFKDLVGVPPGYNLYSGSGDTIESAKKQKIAEELFELKENVIRRHEYLCCQALSGKIDYKIDNQSYSLDFGMPATHKITLETTNKWSETTAKILDNIKAWIRLISSDAGKKAKRAYMGSDVADVFLKDEKIVKLLDTAKASIGEIGFEVREKEGVVYHGRLFGVDLYEYSEEFTDEDGSTKPFIPKNSFILTPEKNRSIFYSGLIKDASLETASALPFFAKSWVEQDPGTRYLLVDSSPLPVPHAPEEFVYALVL